MLLCSSVALFTPSDDCEGVTIATVCFVEGPSFLRPEINPVADVSIVWREICTWNSCIPSLRDET